MLVGLIIGIVMVVVGLIISKMQRGSSVLGVKTRRLQSFSSAGCPSETLKEIVRFAQHAGYKVSARDEAKGLLVLDETAGWLDWGFFLPVSVTRQYENSTLVEIGIKSKWTQFGPVVSRSHNKCVNGIKAALLAQCNK